jgi:hypothetical protein
VTFMYLMLALGIGMIVYGIVTRDGSANSQNGGSDSIVDGCDGSDGSGDGGGDGGGD